MKPFVIAAFGVAMLAAPAWAQEGQRGATAGGLPQACRTAAQAGGQGQLIQEMHSRMSQQMQGMQGMMDGMGETQKGLHRAMMDMHGPMMEGMMAKDADVAWICAMIPHHQGAIAMARAGLRGADNAESKKLAEETIQSNEREVRKLIDWVEKNVERESKNEGTGSQRR